MKKNTLSACSICLLLALLISCKKADSASAVVPPAHPDTLKTDSVKSPSVLLAAALVNNNTNSETTILKADSLWESTGLVYYSVFQKDSVISLYYLCDDDLKHRHLCYAYSKDGIHFIKPNLHQVLFNGNTNNNILSVLLDGASFFYDSASPDAPYKIVGMKSDFKLHVASSYDGLHFTINDKPLVDYFADSQNQVIYDPDLKKYKYYLRDYIHDTQIKKPLHNSSDYRAVGYFEADSLQEIKITGTPKLHPNSKNLYAFFTELPTILNYDRSKTEADIYKPSVVRYGSNRYLSFASVFHYYKGPPEGQFFNDGYNSISLYTSTDGKNFNLYKENFINNEPFSYYLAPGAVYSNGVLFNYYWKVSTTHGNPKRVSEYVVKQYNVTI